MAKPSNDNHKIVMEYNNLMRILPRRLYADIAVQLPYSGVAFRDNRPAVRRKIYLPMAASEDFRSAA
jgi:hypothetical protein